MNDRAPGSKLSTSDTMTRDMWLSTYGSTFRREGAMFRGDPPDSFIHPINLDLIDSVHSQIFNIKINKVTLKGNFPNGPLALKLKHEVC